MQADDTKNVTNDVTKKLAERQRLIYESLPFDVIEDDTKNVTDNVTDDNSVELTERQRVIIEMLPFGVTEDVTETTSTLAQKTGVSRRPITRDMDVLKEKGFVTRIGPDNGGYWKRLK